MTIRDNAPWKTNVWIAAVQGILILMSLVDFFVYAGNFLYALALSVRFFPGFEKVRLIFANNQQTSPSCELSLIMLLYFSNS